jgi:hypothetical protein
MISQKASLFSVFCRNKNDFGNMTKESRAVFFKKAQIMRHAALFWSYGMPRF